MCCKRSIMFQHQIKVRLSIGITNCQEKQPISKVMFLARCSRHYILVCFVWNQTSLHSWKLLQRFEHRPLEVEVPFWNHHFQVPRKNIRRAKYFQATTLNNPAFAQTSPMTLWHCLLRVCLFPGTAKWCHIIRWVLILLVWMGHLNLSLNTFSAPFLQLPRGRWASSLKVQS